MSALPGVAGGGLLEREVELARIDGLLARASIGVGGVVVVEGAAGIGKRELLAAVREGGQERGFAVLKGGGAAADGFGAIHGVFWLVANRGELEPLVVVVDDLQWVDDPSLAWLG